MPPSSLPRSLTVLAALTLLLPLHGCKSILNRYTERANNDPKLRQTIVESSQSSCLKSSREGFPQIANREAIIVDYCKCFAERGMGQFTNAEVAQIGLRPDHQLTPEQNKKLDTAVDMCMDEAKSKVAVPAQ